MQTIEISTLSDLMSRSYARSASDIAPASVVIPIAKPVAEYRTVSSNRATMMAVSLMILTLIDLNVVMWAGAVSAQVAEWIGISLATCAWIGVIAIPAAIPLAVLFNRFAWRWISR